MSARSIALLFSPIGLLLISATRLLIISDYNVTTAITVASSGGYVNTLLGAVIPLIPIFIPYIALILLLSGRFLLSIIAFIFTVFMAPTPIAFPVTLRVAKADEHQLLAQISTHSLITATIATAIIAILTYHHRSLIDALSIGVAMMVTLALLFTNPSSKLSLPVSLRSASNGEHEIIDLVAGNGLIIFSVVLIISFLLIYYGSFPAALTTAVAISATLILLPYIYNIYPIPRHSNYYADVLHEPWLPAEKIVLSSGVIYYGYVLSNYNGWFTVLLVKSRTIVYIPANKVVGRSVCQTKLQSEPKQYPPLIPLLYTLPPPIPACGNGDSSSMIRSVLSHGETLNEISSAIHVSPKQIISTTKAYQRQRLSAALRAYERSGDWNAPTTAGQHFWYYPPITP
jgi:hypothetical protein